MADNLRGIRRADLAPFLRQFSPASITRYLWRLRQFGLIKKVVHGYRYYLTRLGRSTIAAACRITEQSIVPALAHACIFRFMAFRSLEEGVN